MLQPVQICDLLKGNIFISFQSLKVLFYVEFNIYFLIHPFSRTDQENSDGGGQKHCHTHEYIRSQEPL